MHTSIMYETINDSSLSRPINETLTRSFTSSEYSLIEIKKEEIKPCMGCFGCWTKTPGQCVITNDTIAKTNPCFVQSDFVVIVSSIHYGCYSATTKRIFDRVIPNILPFFRKYKNEVHHEMRYKHLTTPIIFAYGEDITPGEKETFLKLTKANATNLGIADTVVHFCTSPAEIAPIITKIKEQIYSPQMKGVL